MAALNGYNANDHEPTDFSPIPAGEYTAAITASEEKATKAGDGSFHSLTFQILEGQYKGRNLWLNLNLNNRNAEAVKIAKGQLSTICRAVGVMQPQDTVELHKLPMTIVVKCRTNKQTNEIENVIRGFKKEGVAGGVAPQSPTGTAAPWKR